jgi:glyoxylase-like metal-dependent hydrolase (beta-lactamase superfamily II)
MTTTITEGVTTWEWFSERNGYDFHGTWVRHGAWNLVIDPVEPTDELLRRLVESKLERILLTNRNHFRAAARIRQATEARVAVHPADADFVRGKGVVVDDELLPGQVVGPFHVISAAGKSPGEIALHWPDRRLLVVGDACIGSPPGKLGLLPAKVIDDLPALRASLTRIAAEIDFDILVVGDGVHILSGGRDALAALVATFG